jgi:hypothetical protein
MTDFHNTLIESSKSLKESKLDKLDIPIISEDTFVGSVRRAA